MKLLSLLILIINLSFIPNLLIGSDTTVIQTLTFDDITKRRGVWKFPDNPENFRKILMLYTLKCDPRTTHDRYNCGEWDYLTYNLIHKKTGLQDSSQLEYYLYRLGNSTPDTINYTTKQTITTFKRKFFNRNITSIVSQEDYKVAQNDKTIQINSKKFRLQWSLTSKELKNYGFSRGEINRLKFYFEKPILNVKNFKIKMSGGSLDEKFNNTLETYFLYNFEKIDSGWVTFNLLNPFSWNGLSGITFELSLESDSNENIEVKLGAFERESSFFSSISDNFLYFDGINDWVQVENLNLNNLSKFTIESWLKAEQFKSMADIFNYGDKVIIRMGRGSGELYFYINNPDESYAVASNAVSFSEWTHIAMVYDGSQAENKDKLKVFINGKPSILSFNGKIPSITSSKIEKMIIGHFNYKGGIDEVRLWNEALSEATITEWFNKDLTSEHPNYSNILAYYPANENGGTELPDKSSSNKNGTLIGCPEWSSTSSDFLFKEIKKINLTPSFVIIRGEYESTMDSSQIITELVPNPPISIQKYKIENYQPVISEILYGWNDKYEYTFDQNNKVIDSTKNNLEKQIINSKAKYYGKPYDIYDDYEIGRFITPYGINLDLGPDGFSWMYDVTDYAYLLIGDVEFSAGNQQELIDVKFLFIHGTPPRKVLKHDRIWGKMSDYLYKDLSNDIKLSETKIDIQPNAKTFKIKTRITGHGHQSNDGNYPHCCEWKDNTHYLYLNGDDFAEWHIFQYNNCALNPVFPQGGTWPGSREGWCPGDIVKDYEFDATKAIKGNSVLVDYDITKVPTSNQGMGNGNYVMNFDFFQYSEQSFDTDLEIYDVIMPSDWEYYSRKNPICSHPKIVVRNNGKSSVSNVKIRFGVLGGAYKETIWTPMPPIESNQSREIVLSIDNNSFWLGDGTNRFEAEIIEVNGKKDDYSENDKYISTFKLPDLYKNKFVIWYKSNNRPQDYTYTITDLNNRIVFAKNNVSPNTTYTDTIDLPAGCYKFEFLDKNNLGLSYWAYPAQGNGAIQIRDVNGNVLKAFNPDFGRSIYYEFSTGEISFVKDNQSENLIYVYPNPTNEKIIIESEFDFGLCEFSITDISGRTIDSKILNIKEGERIQFDVVNYPTGTYLINFKNKAYNFTKKFIKE
ncbi:MAG: peptide-N-glycosidase F-related protein [Candidatus Kapabacteria bacterium]|nr:peptide-N-glycosidase F-related protein [Candidatus Kapabacteria bacterium]